MISGFADHRVKPLHQLELNKAEIKGWHPQAGVVVAYAVVPETRALEVTLECLSTLCITTLQRAVFCQISPEPAGPGCLLVEIARVALTVASFQGRLLTPSFNLVFW